MYFEYAAMAAVAIFAILVFYIIRTLLSLQRTLERVDHLTLELGDKLQQLESTTKAISNVGDICEEKTARLRESYFNQRDRTYLDPDYTDEIADWLLATIKIGSKYIRRK